MGESQILVLGAINRDEVARVSRHPMPGETVVSESVEFFHGGKGANQAVAASATGQPVRVTMIAAVGDDGAGASALKSLKSAGIDVSLVRTVLEVPTGRAYITVSSDGQNSIVVGLGANRFVSPSGIPPTTRADVLLAQTEVGAAPVQALARLAARSEARFVLNDGPVVALDAETMRLADPLIVNEYEARALVDVAADDSAEMVAGRIRDVFGSRSVIVTLGADGCVILDQNGLRRHPAEPVAEVIDTTGAGDAFVGTFAAAVAAGADNDTAVRRGTQAAAIAVTWKGARPYSTTRSSDAALGIDR